MNNSKKISGEMSSEMGFHESTAMTTPSAIWISGIEMRG